MRETSSEQDPTPPSGQFDTVSKRVIQQNPEDWIRFALGISEVKVIQILDTEQPTVRAHRADSFIHVDILGKEAVMHFEFQKPPEPMDSGAWLRECVRVADTLPLDEPDKPDYLSSLVILSGLILNFQTIRQIISEETMYESSVIQHFTEQGERKGTIESLLDVLDVRFQSSEVQTLKPKIESIEELQTLKQLHREALQVSSLDEFRRILSSNGK